MKTRAPTPDCRRRCSRACALALPHARRVGAARGHLARLAAQRDDWPGKFEPSLGLRRDRPQSARGRARQIIVNDARAARPRARRVDCALGVTGADAVTNAARFICWPTDRVWTRDYRPDRSSRNRQQGCELPVIDWRFNAWAKYDELQARRQLGARMARAAAAPVVHPMLGNGRRAPLVLEGGTIDVNGRGTLLTTEECLLSNHAAAQPGMDRADYEPLRRLLRHPIRSSGSATASRATTPTATSTISPASSRPTPSSPWSSRTRTTPTTRPARQSRPPARRPRPGRPAAAA